MTTSSAGARRTEPPRQSPSIGCPRIACIISRTFGVDIDKHLVRRVLVKTYRPRGGDGPSWLSFIGHTRDSLWSVDLFRCESIVLQSYWVLVVMDQFTRRIIGLGVHHGDVDGANLCRMCNEAIRGHGTPVGSIYPNVLRQSSFGVGAEPGPTGRCRRY